MLRKIIFLFLVLLFAGFAAYKNWQSQAPVETAGSKFVKVAKNSKDEFNIVIIGDTGTGNNNQFSVAKAIDRYCENNDLDFIVMLGDNFYQAGVRSITDKQWQTKWQDVYLTDCLKSKSSIQFWVITTTNLRLEFKLNILNLITVGPCPHVSIK